jgi:hypothetical protein
MYWTKINSRIIGAIFIAILLFFLIGCLKKVENPKPVTVEKVVTGDNGEVQTIKTQVYNGKNRYQIGLEVTKDNEKIKNFTIKNWLQVGLKVTADGVEAYSFTVDNIGQSQTFTNQAGARILGDGVYFHDFTISNTGYDGLGVQGKNAIIRKGKLLNIATIGHTNGDGIMFMIGGTGSVYDTHIELKSFVKHCIKGSADNRATLFDAIGNTCIGGASGIIASPLSVIKDNKISGQQSNPETGVEGRGIVLTNFKGTCSGNTLTNCPVGILVSNSPDLDIEKLRRENVFVNCGIDIKVK